MDSEKFEAVKTGFEDRMNVLIVNNRTELKGLAGMENYLRNVITKAEDAMKTNGFAEIGTNILNEVLKKENVEFVSEDERKEFIQDFKPTFNYWGQKYITA